MPAKKELLLRAVPLLGVLIASYIFSILVFKFLVASNPQNGLPEIERCITSLEVESIYIDKSCRENTLTLLVSTEESFPLVEVIIERDIEGNALKLKWEFAQDLIFGIEKAYGENEWFGEAAIVQYTRASAFAVGAWNTRYNIPPGAFSPYLKQILAKAFLIRETKIPDEAQARIANLIVNELGKSIDLKQVDSHAKSMSLYSGPIQFFTLLVFFVTFIFIIGSIRYRSLKPTVELLAPLILYVGFLGTLMGMSLGLGILGNADLTDELSKGVSLGPIGSQIGLALNTTMFGVVLFLIASFSEALVDRLTSENVKK